MPSIRASLLLFLLKNRHLLRGKLQADTGEDWADDLAAVRAKAAAAARIMGKVPKGFTVSPEALNGIASEWIAPPDARQPAQGMVLYFHGGGYVLGAVESHRAIVAKYLKEDTVPALVFGYRLAPEHPHPAALDDALAVYVKLLDRGIPPHKIVFAGDSAGGGLLLSLLAALRDQGSPLPAGAVALSPWTDLACTGDSITSNADRCLSPKNSWQACRDHYVAGADPTDPRISPLYANLSGLPPLLLFAGEHETLRSDSQRFAEKAATAGTDVRLTVGKGLCHCYPVLAPMFPEATQAMRNIRTFIRERIED